MKTNNEILSKDVIIKQLIRVINLVSERLGISSVTIAHWIYQDFLGKHDEN